MSDFFVDSSTLRCYQLVLVSVMKLSKRKTITSVVQFSILPEFWCCRYISLSQKTYYIHCDCKKVAQLKTRQIFQKMIRFFLRLVYILDSIWSTLQLFSILFKLILFSEQISFRHIYESPKLGKLPKKFQKSCSFWWNLTVQNLLLHSINWKLL